ncbi:MAG: exonuclease subunit SbcD [Synechococcaceae cyanobacterium SM1_2_3]|nr:exonuclease subunit SbcD [Synechococcaceae cyanobacterium SM1_2_3]
MRLLHTSDWHLGQTLHDFDRVYEHQCFLDWLLNTLEAEQIDALLIAGDIFDHSNPSAESQRQFYRFLSSAKRRLPDLDVIIIAGNHDSAGRLEAPIPLMESFDIKIVGTIARNADNAIQLDRLIAPLKNRDGEIAAWCLAVPFLRPGDVPRVETDGDPYLEGVKLLYRQVLDHALNLRENGQAIIALGHCHMNGGETSDESERRLVIGGSEALPVDIFDPVITYAALGHLHRAQKVGGQERVRYCGSPLPMSFTEIHYPHQVVRIDLDGESTCGNALNPIPRFVELLRVPQQPAPMDEVLAMLKALNLTDKPRSAQPYLQVRVLLNGPEPALRAYVDSALNGKPVRLVKIEPSYSNKADGNDSGDPQSLDDLGRMQPDDIFSKLHRRKYGAEPSTKLLRAFTELLLTADQESER